MGLAQFLGWREESPQEAVQGIMNYLDIELRNANIALANKRAARALKSRRIRRLLISKTDPAFKIAMVLIIRFLFASAMRISAKIIKLKAEVVKIEAAKEALSNGDPGPAWGFAKASYRSACAFGGDMGGIMMEHLLHAFEIVKKQER